MPKASSRSITSAALMTAKVGVAVEVISPLRTSYRAYSSQRLFGRQPALANKPWPWVSDAPRYILADGAAGTRIQAAPFINHDDDDELTLIEALLGREPPFAVFGGSYGPPRLNY